MSESENQPESVNGHGDSKRKRRSANETREFKKKLIERDGNACQITGEPFENYNEMAINHLLPLSLGGKDDLANSQLVKHKVNSLLSNKDTLRIDAITKDLLSRQEELAKREQENFSRELEYRLQIDKQKQDLERLRTDLQQEYESRKDEVEKELKLYQEKIKQQLLDLQTREMETNKLRQILQEQIADHEIKFKHNLDELERDKERYREESRNQIQARSNSYVNDAILALDTSANSYHTKGTLWSIAGLLSLAGGVGTGIFFGLAGITALENSDKISWPVVSFLAFKGIIVIGLFVALAKYCFSYSQSFTHEAIKNSERKHAINFGKFYLETYGAEAQWGQVKEAFEHWNINSSSAFSGNDPDKFDPKLFDKAIEIAEAVQKFGKTTKEDSTSKKQP